MLKILIEVYTQCWKYLFRYIIFSVESLCKNSSFFQIQAIAAIKEAYQTKYGITLEEDIIKEIKGKLKHLFLALAKVR